MNNYFKNIKDIFTGKIIEEENGELTNQQLEDKIFEVYEKQFKKESTKRTMLFPTCFRIYLHSKDFAARQDAFNVLARDMANDFNAYNRTEMHKYQHSIPHSEYWLFQFIEFKEGTIVGDSESIEMGEIYTISTLYSQDFSKKKDNISNEKNVTLTKTHKNSTDGKELNNVNINAFLGMDSLDGNRFKVNINPNYEDSNSVPRSEDKTQTVENDAIAYLICDKKFIAGQNRGNKYNITTNYLFLSGKGDTRQGVQYAKIDYNLPDDVAHIKYENGNFFIVAFGKVRLNGGLIAKSEGAPSWQPLANNSKMLIEDEVSIEFKIN